MQSMAHSALALAIPRSGNCRQPLACLICPKTASSDCPGQPRPVMMCFGLPTFAPMRQTLGRILTLKIKTFHFIINDNPMQKILRTQARRHLMGGDNEDLGVAIVAGSEA